MGLGQSMTTSRRLLQPTMPSSEPSNVNEKQYKPIHRPRRRRAGAKARGENGPPKVKKPRARDYYERFLAKNGTGEGSVPRGGPPRDGRGRFVAMKGSRRGVGGGTCVNQYESIVNLQAPDLTTLLGIMDGGRHGIKGSKHYRNIARLQDPGFASVLNAMNNISYKAVDDGPYDVLKLIGSPDDSSLGFLRSDNARRYMRQLPQYPRQDFRLRFCNMSPGAVDLLERMLVFDPSRRITVDEALHHPYLTSLHDINEEPTCPSHFSFDFEQPSFTEQHIKELIWRESLGFNPDPPY